MRAVPTTQTTPATGAQQPVTPPQIPKVITPAGKLDKGTPVGLVIIFLIVFIGLGIILLSANAKKEREAEEKKTEELLEKMKLGWNNAPMKDSVIVVRQETFFLGTKDTVVRVYINPYESCYCSGGGKQYYRQPQNGDKVLQGGGLQVQTTEHTAFIDLSPAEEDSITIVCTFTKTIQVPVKG